MSASVWSHSSSKLHMHFHLFTWRDCLIGVSVYLPTSSVSISYDNLRFIFQPLTCSADTTTEHYDLSSLVLSEGYHSAITAPDVGGDASYYINLCRPLNPIPDTKCPPQAAVCKVDSKGTITVSMQHFSVLEHHLCSTRVRFVY